MRVTYQKSEQIHTMQYHPNITIGALSILMLGLLFIPQAWGGESKRDIVIIVDNSGSMKKNDPEFLAHRALKNFVSTSGGDTRLALISFDKNVNLSVPFTPLTDTSRSIFFNAVDKIDYSGPLTNSPEALEGAIYEFTLHGRAGAEESIVFITDGIVDTGNKARDRLQESRMQHELSTLASKLNIRIFGIAFAEAANYPLIEAIVSKTNGEYFKVLTAEELPGVLARIEAISRPAPATNLRSNVLDPSLSLDGQFADITSPAVSRDSLPRKAALGTDSEIETASEIQELDDSAGSSGTLENQPVGKPNNTEGALNSAERLSSAGLQPLNIPDRLLNKARRFYSGNELIINCAALIASLAIGTLLFLRKRRPNETTSHIVYDKSFREGRLAAVLIDVDNYTSVRNHPLTSRITRIGRAKTGATNEDIQHLWIDKSTIGREHAYVEYKDGGYWLIDNDSTNGTFVDGKCVKDRVRLKDGSRISFHDVQFIFSIPELGRFEKTVSVPVLYPRESTEYGQDTVLIEKLEPQHSLKKSLLPTTSDNRTLTDIRTYRRSQENTGIRLDKCAEHASTPISDTNQQDRNPSNDHEGAASGSVNIRQAKYASKTVTALQFSSPMGRNPEKFQTAKQPPDGNTVELDQFPRHSNTEEIEVLSDV